MDISFGPREYDTARYEIRRPPLSDLNKLFLVKRGENVTDPSHYSVIECYTSLKLTVIKYITRKSYLNRATFGKVGQWLKQVLGKPCKFFTNSLQNLDHMVCPKKRSNAYYHMLDDDVRLFCTT